MSQFKFMRSQQFWQMVLLLAVVTGCISSGEVSGVSPTPTESAAIPSTPATVPSDPANSGQTPSSTSSPQLTPDGAVAQAPDCTSPQTQVDINQCAAKSADLADEELNQVYQQVKSTLSANEERLLTDAQLAWIEFRDKNCAFSRSRFEGGSIAPTVYSECIKRVTQQRTEELEGYGQSMEDGGLF